MDCFLNNYIILKSIAYPFHFYLSFRSFHVSKEALCNTNNFIIILFTFFKHVI